MAADDLTEQEKPSLWPSDDALGALAALRRAALRPSAMPLQPSDPFPYGRTARWSM